MLIRDKRERALHERTSCVSDIKVTATQAEFMTVHQVDPAIRHVARARDLEAARIAVLAAGGGDDDVADDAIFDALDAIPTTLKGVRAKIAMALEIEGPCWPDDAITLFRSLLASPALTKHDEENIA